jgi:putative acetyltransferase
MQATGIDETALAKAQSGHSEAQIVNALRTAGMLTLSLVAERDGAACGHIAFSPVTVGSEMNGWYGLGPVAVLPEKQGDGMGSALIREGLARITVTGARGCVLLGYPPYYARFGFELDERLTYFGRPNPALQRIVFTGSAPQGDVVYHPAFDP